MLASDVPVDPSAPVASQWLISELAKPIYQAAKPTLFDRLAKAVSDWFASLKFGNVTGPPAFGIGVVIVLVIAAIVVAFLIFGLPRLNRRSALAGSLFGDDDTRDSAAIRAAGEAAARAGDFSLAVIEMFRAIARGLAERTILTTSPGTTARSFAATAGIAFPELADRLAASAIDFDAVRYLGRSASREQFESVAAVERDLRAARAVLETTAG
jgi:hypothetical protein